MFPQERNSSTISIRPFLSQPLVCSLHQDGEGAAHDTLGHSEGVQHRSEPADQTQPTRSHHQLLPHPRLPAAHLHRRLAHVTPQNDNHALYKTLDNSGELMMQHMFISWNDSRAALIFFIYVCCIILTMKSIFLTFGWVQISFLYWYIKHTKLYFWKILISFVYECRPHRRKQSSELV